MKTSTRPHSATLARGAALLCAGALTMSSGLCAFQQTDLRAGRNREPRPELPVAAQRDVDLSADDATAHGPFGRGRHTRLVDGLQRAELFFATEADGSTWVRAQSYKARFGTGGATYIPYFGAEAPRNFPVEISLASARIGGVPLEIAPALEAKREGNRIVIDRGIIDEVYELALDHVEQMFVIESRPAAGALDLFVPLAGELSLQHASDGAVLVGDHGAVRYGRAFALRADGSRAPLVSTMENGGVRIHVEADFMASAHFPLVIDPVVSTFPIVQFSTTQIDSDISYDVTTDRYLTVWEEVFSATDGDVFGQLRDSNGTVHGENFLDITSADWRSPQTANLNNYDQFLVVAQVMGFGATTGWIIQGLTVQAATFGQGVNFTISTPDQAGDKLYPDVGGDPFLGTAYYCVTWHRTKSASDTDIHARLVRNDSTLVGGSTILIDNSNATLDSRPSVSKSNGQLGGFAAWTIAWHRLNAEYDIYAARISYSGLILNPSALVLASNLDDYYPRVATPFLDGTVVVIYAGSYTTQHDIHYLVLSGTTLQAFGNLTSLDVPNEGNRDQIEYSIDSDRERFVVAYAQDSFANPGQYDTFVSAFALVSPTEVRATEAHLPLDTSPGQSARTDTVSKWSSGGTGQRFRIVWDTTSATSSTDIYGADYERQLGGVVTSQCFGDAFFTTCPCSNFGSAGRGCANSANAGGALLSWQGNPQTGAGDTLHLLLDGAPPGAPALLFQGTTTTLGIQFGDGKLCVSGTITRIGVKFASPTGGAEWPSAGDAALSVSGGIPLAGGDRFLQAYYRDSATFCTSSTFNLSNGLKVFWLP